MTCIPRVQWKEVMMYFYLHAFWQNTVIIHKWLATVTWIRESASCQKSKHQNSPGPCRIRAPRVYFICCLIPQTRSSFEYGSLCLGLQKLKELAQSIKKKKKAYSHFSHSHSAFCSLHFRYILHVKKRACSITVRELCYLSQKMIWSLCPSALTLAVDVFRTVTKLMAKISWKYHAVVLLKVWSKGIKVFIWWSLFCPTHFLGGNRTWP